MARIIGDLVGSVYWAASSRCFSCSCSFSRCAACSGTGNNKHGALVALPLLNIDLERMREVLANLIANALRYTPRGGSISVKLGGIHEDGMRRALVIISDSGPGITPEDLPHIFDRFYKARDSGGMGLGLSIAKYLTEAHGGTLQAESEIGQGTMMRITLAVEEGGI